MTNAVLFTNNATTSLAGNILAGDTTLTVGAGGGAFFPSLSGGDYFYCTLQNSTGTVREIIKVTTRTGDVFNVIVRAQEGTSASGFSTNDTVELRLTSLGITTAITDKTTPLQTQITGLAPISNLSLFKLGVI